MTMIKKSTLGVMAAAIVVGAAFVGSTVAQDSKQAILDKTFSEIQADSALMEYALSHGGAAFKQHCAECHGVDGRGQVGIPNLTDRDWLWGGDIDTIYETIRYGIRDEHFMSRFSAMPNLPRSNLLTEEEVNMVADFVLILDEKPDFFSPSGKLYTANCSGCHGPYGEGFTGFGAPPLNDEIWFYGSTREDIMSQVMKPKHGVMPAWEDKLAPETIKELALYVHSLGGGEE